MRKDWKRTSCRQLSLTLVENTDSLQSKVCAIRPTVYILPPDMRSVVCNLP